MSRASLSILLLPTLIGLAFPAAALPISNGDFSTFVPSNGSGGGWSSEIIDANGGWRSTTSENSFENFFILNNNGGGADPALTQTLLGLSVGEFYTVTGEFESFRPNDGDPSALSFGVEIVGVALQEFMRPPALLGAFELTFQAVSTSHVLRLTAERNGDDSAYAVDNIAVSAVPEASTGLLLGLAGLAGLVRLGRPGYFATRPGSRSAASASQARGGTQPPQPREGSPPMSQRIFSRVALLLLSSFSIAPAAAALPIVSRRPRAFELSPGEPGPGPGDADEWPRPEPSRAIPA